MKAYDHGDSNDKVTMHTCHCGNTVRICDYCPNEDNLTKCWESCKRCPTCRDKWRDEA